MSNPSPLPLEGECPKGRGLAEGKRAKPTSGATRHLLPEEGGRSGMSNPSPLPMEGGCPKGRGLAKVERERSREIFLAHRISRLVSLAVGSILLVSCHQTSSIFLPARGIPRLRSG